MGRGVAIGGVGDPAGWLKTVDGLGQAEVEVWLMEMARPGA